MKCSILLVFKLSSFNKPIYALFKLIEKVEGQRNKQKLFACRCAHRKRIVRND